MFPSTDSATPLLPRHDPIDLLDTAALRQLEQAPGHADGELMARAGLSVARLVRALWPQARRVSLLCGPGNNGGDGWVAARHLKALGLVVQVLEPVAARRPSAERQQAVAAGRAIGLVAMPLAALDPQADLLVDALIGLGLRAAPEGELAAAIHAMNRHPAPKLGVDLPSGLQADTGAAAGAAVRCTHTLCLLAPTPGLLTGDGRQQAGRLWLDRLGCSHPAQAAVARAGAARGSWRALAPRARRPHSSHKGSAGQVWVLQGAPAMAGAARLAARAALAAGAGRVHLSGQADAVDADPLWPELMRSPLEAAIAQLPSGVGVLGCGGGEPVAALMPPWLERAAQLVLDADALNALAARAELQQMLRTRSERGQRSVLTPHPLEAARLLGLADAATVQADRLGCARELVVRFGCTVVLKGSGSVIASPGALPHINTSGHAALGTAGSGDVLAGWLGGLMAQAPEAPLQQLTAIACAWQGDAADALPPGGGPLRASALIKAMAALYP